MLQKSLHSRRTCYATVLSKDFRARCLHTCNSIRVLWNFSSRRNQRINLGYGERNIITIKQQLVEERTLQEDMTFSHPHRVLKDPKGNPFYSIRTEELPEAGINILRKMKELNPNGKLVFMHEGRPLTTDTFNRRLKKYCGELGITYLSSHKSALPTLDAFDAGVKAIDIQPLLGHSNLAMTQHYIGQRTTERDSTEMARILA